ncbi:MAG: glucosyl-3-phosphoglycerate synthase, partial [Deltaproteobacteria bacterium]|nr:glucosyl-3-phosphoglycerate synthase [Deltaproteobacteria bacterium]
MNSTWLEKNTFHYSEFNDLGRLVEEKRRKNLKISLCLPTLNEEKTIAKEILIVKSELMTRYPLLDEIVVIDSESTDKTREIARSFGADVYKATEILPDLESFKGKGENLWKALYVTKGDIIVYIDADIKNIHHRFVYGLLGPLILFDNIKYVKAFYDRPIAMGKSKIRPTGGGRVTELVVRPLFSLFFPELTQILQPLSGEYAGFREIYEAIPFPIGYGVETSMILDIYEKWGLDVIAQVDLDRRIHRNQDTRALGKMAFVILMTFINRKIKLGLIDIKEDLFSEMIQYNLVKDEYKPDVFQIEGYERPPIIEIP